MTYPVVWVHGDVLSPYGPALKVYPDAPAIWVWDDALIEEWQLSLKRITFIYECLLELPVVIRRGDVWGFEIVSPRFKDICNRSSVPVEVLAVGHGYIGLKRF